MLIPHCDQRHSEKVLTETRLEIFGDDVKLQETALAVMASMKKQMKLQLQATEEHKRFSVV